MAAVGGSIQDVTIRGRLLPVTADADVTRNLGGFENEIAANGDGTARIIKTRVPWGLSGLVVEIDEDRGDQQFLQEIANGTDYVAVSITFASGVTYQASGTVADTIEFSSQNATATISLMGQGEMTQQ